MVADNAKQISSLATTNHLQPNGPQWKLGKKPILISAWDSPWLTRKKTGYKKSDLLKKAPFIKIASCYKITQKNNCLFQRKSGANPRRGIQWFQPVVNKLNCAAKSIKVALNS